MRRMKTRVRTTIALKAITKDRSERYESAGALAADLRRYLANEPVEARRPSRAYQLRLFARRNRALVGSVVMLIAVLIAGLSAALWQAGIALAALDDYLSRSEAPADEKDN